MKGLIVWWSGAIADIPAGWHLCDGTEGTPNLRNKFVIGAGDTYAVDAVGGSVDHHHGGHSNGHFHYSMYGSWLGPGSDFQDPWSTEHLTITTDTKPNLPPYYALAMIMKLWD